MSAHSSRMYVKRLFSDRAIFRVMAMIKKIYKGYWTSNGYHLRFKGLVGGNYYWSPTES